MIKPVMIDDETAHYFLYNLSQKKFMVCFMYYDFGRENKPEDLCIDIAKTKYLGNGRFSINCRGTGYLDNAIFEYRNEISWIKKYVHSFIECEEPNSREGGQP